MLKIHYPEFLIYFIKIKLMYLNKKLLLLAVNLLINTQNFINIYLNTKLLTISILDYILIKKAYLNFIIYTKKQQFN